MGFFAKLLGKHEGHQPDLQLGVNADGLSEKLYEQGFEHYMQYKKDAGDGKQNQEALNHAITYFKLAIYNNPSQGKAIALLGLSYALKGNMKLAIRFCRDAMDFHDQLGCHASEIEEFMNKLQL
ncbi:MAG: hypothetical protein HGA72_03835 [Chlorobiaceae bacterium]|nr:hypothetical protein [Chlorobiaceae bacterium]